MSVTFLLGSPIVKRKYLRANAKNAVYADNDDVLGFFDVEGELYCMPAPLPFADLKIGEFVRYKRAFTETNSRPLTNSEMKSIMKLFRFDIPPKAKVGSLSKIDYRHLLLVAGFKTGIKEVALNLDGLPFRRSFRRKLFKLIGRLSKTFDITVSVGDSRYLLPKAKKLTLKENGEIEENSPARYKSRIVSKKKVAVFFSDKTLPPNLSFASLPKPVLITSK